MSDYVIITDSTTDLTKELIADMDVTVMPMAFTIDGETYFDDPFDRQIEPPAFYDLVRAGKQAVTAQINASTYIERLEPILRQGKDILLLVFSSGLSGTYQSATMAAADLKEKYPDRKIIAVDTRSASMGEGLLVYHVAMLRKNGADIETAAQWAEDNCLRLCHWFTVDDLNHLKRGGRVLADAALVGTILGIKPVLHVDDQGHLIPMQKVRGRRQSLDALVDKLAQTYDSTSPQTVFISHGDCLEDARYVEQQLRSRVDVKDVYINFIGPVIGAHSGPGTVAVFFLGSKR